jgi:hypothetical protein
MRNVIKLKYTIISFIIGLIPFIIISSIISTSPKHETIHSTTLICFGLLTSICNALYTYYSISNKLNKNTHQ